jgi:glutamate carboxypeptidase
MDLTQLPLEEESMLVGLKRWVECESPTYDKPAVDRMMTLAAEDLTRMGAEVERVNGPLGLGDCVRASFPHPRHGEPGILIMAHLDTVHPIGTLEKLPFRRDGGRCYGPGILDMKGGIYAALQGVRALRKASFETPLPVHVLLTSDEEIGSPGTRDLIEAEAKKHRFILIPEPAFMQKGGVTGRYAIARFHLTAYGRASHAGEELKKGRSAVREMAQQVLTIESMTDDNCTFSVGVIHGGQWVNCVPTLCRAEALSMAKRQSDLDRGIERLMELNHNNEGTSFTVETDVVRPVWEPSDETMALYERARRVAGRLGLELPQGSAGGGSDGNFTGAIGLPTLDGLGLRGVGLHTLDEHIEIDSLIERSRLTAGLIAELGS